VQHTSYEGTSYFNTAGELIIAPLDKNRDQTHKGNTAPLPGREGQNAELKKPLWGKSDSAATVGKVSHFTALKKLGAG
jgi:hypothetical protein